MNAEKYQHYLSKFDEKDTDNKGSINLKQFTSLFSEIMGGNSNDESAEMYFRGIDINDNNVITRKEFSDFVTASLTNDEDYMIQLAFRSFDKDQSKNLNCAEVKAITKYVGRDMTDEEIESAMQSYTGSKKGSLTYAQIYKMITGKDLEGAKSDKTKSENTNSEKRSSVTVTGIHNRDAPSEVSVKPHPTKPANPAASSTPAAASSAQEDAKKKSKCCLLI